MGGSGGHSRDYRKVLCMISRVVDWATATGRRIGRYFVKQSLRRDYPRLGETTWTPERVKELLEAVDGHIDSCADCQERLQSPPPQDADAPYFCSVAETLIDVAGDAELEYSWQDDFNPAVLYERDLKNICRMAGVDYSTLDEEEDEQADTMGAE